MFEVIKFDEKYLKDFIYDGIESEIIDYDIKEVVKKYASAGESFMGFNNHQLFGMGGVFPFFDTGIGQIWLLLNQEVYDYKTTAFRLIKEHLMKIIERQNYRSIQILCLAENEKATTLIEHLGFTEKELWRRYII